MKFLQNVTQKFIDYEQIPDPSEDTSEASSEAMTVQKHDGWKALF